ncbi:hypothetical protein L484_011524 [Morus notabilis]|uniref:Uncharacterized protein n=1 Tax=Morus notabilis TaxID=981085 RepID=W9RNP5_9ROSA|nr:hypothetical protein L484_011524 [Morus notabilis]
MFGNKLRIIVLKQLEGLFSGDPELLLCRSRRVLEIVNLENSTNTTWAKIKLSNT